MRGLGAPPAAWQGPPIRKSIPTQTQTRNRRCLKHPVNAKPRPHRRIGADSDRRSHPLPVGQPRGRGTADRWCVLWKYGWGGWTVRSCWWPRVVVGNLPVGFASTQEQRRPGRTQGHNRKPQLEAEQSAAQRPGEDRGRQPSPLGPDWMSLCVGKRRADRRISRAEHAPTQAGLPPRQRRARSFPAEPSTAAPQRTSTSAAQARSRAQRAGLAVRG